jgi:hypothetical protein
MESKEDFSGEVSMAEKPRQTTDMETQLAARMASCSAHGPGKLQINFTKRHIQTPWKIATRETKTILENA